MNINEYKIYALRTENLDEKSIASRVNENDVKEMRVMLNEVLDLSRRLDSIKKWLFYGKGNSLGDGSSKLDSLRLTHSVLGLVTEVGEIIEKYLTNDKSLMKEFGDVAWYWVQGLDAIGVVPSYCLMDNINKLRARYPKVFDETLAKEHKGE